MLTLRYQAEDGGKSSDAHGLDTLLILSTLRQGMKPTLMGKLGNAWLSASVAPLASGTRSAAKDATGPTAGCGVEKGVDDMGAI